MTTQGAISIDNNSPNGNSNPLSPPEEHHHEKEKTYPVKKKRHLYITFRNCRVYLESNNIMLNEYINKNPFQPKPFYLPYSEEFIEAVKFSKYDVVKNALKINKDFLFVYDYFKQTAYHWAAKLGDLKMLELLVSNGKYLNQHDKKKRTPLYLAAMNNQFECCDYLVKHHANCFMEDIEGKKAIDVATDTKIKVLLSDQMDNKYTNPYIKHRINVLLKMREDIIARRKAENELINGAEDKMKKEKKQNNNI